MRYGFSSPEALLQATKLARRAALGFLLALFFLTFQRRQGQDVSAAAAYATVYVYVFTAVAMMSAGRRRMLESGRTARTWPWAGAVALLGAGGVLLVFGMLSLVLVTLLIAGMLPT